MSSPEYHARAGAGQQQQQQPTDWPVGDWFDHPV